MVFDSEIARAAAKKRKHRFASVATLAKAAAKSKKANKTHTTRTVARMNVAFRNNTGSGGANNAMTPGAVEAALDALSKERPMTKKSVLVDFGCGSGNLLVAAVMRYGVKAYGIEKDNTAFQAAVINMKKISWDQSKRIVVLKGDFNESRFGVKWVKAIGATHVVVFDKAFNLDSIQKLFKTIAKAQFLVGISSARPNSNVKLPGSFNNLGNLEKPTAVIGGQQIKMRLWTNQGNHV
jgi:SAM-dependent methyltransferase